MRTFSLAMGLSLASALAGPAATAAGFGPGPGSVPMGSPLVVALPVLLDEGDVLEPECVSAEVSIGDRRVPAYNVRWVLEPGAGPRDRVVRVGTLVNVDEPLVMVQLNVGCTHRISRRFTVFADPPALAAAPPAPADAQQVVGPATAPAGAAAREMAEAPRRPTALPPRGKALAAVDAREAPAADASGAAPARTARSTRPPRTARSADAARSTRAGKASADRPAAVAKADARSAANAAPRAAPRSRLTLEAAEPPRPDDASAAIAEAASAVSSAMQTIHAVQTAASAAQARAQTLEVQVEKLLADGRQMQAENQQLRRRLAAADAGPGWVPWLLGAIALLAAVSAWLGLRLRRLRRLAHAQWWKAAQAEANAAPDAGPGPAAAATPMAAARSPQASPAAAAPARHEAESSWAAEPVGASIPTTMIVEPGWTTQTPPRAVTVEELIDLEQQAEFFVVLGQDDAAIDLLVSHIRSTGGISPLPYLKLLEIYRRRGETDSYERTRARFNQRFNAYAPDWDADLQHGRLLEDYPEVIASVQRAWSSPTAAMAALEDLLFRKDGGQMFDLPAYREVLLLYSLARDLLDHGGATQGAIDLLLPMEASVQRAARLPRRPDETLPVQPQLSFDRTASPPALDLDLSLFGEFDTEVTQPGAFTDLERGMDSRLADLPTIDQAPPRRARS